MSVDAKGESLTFHGAIAMVGEFARLTIDRKKKLGTDRFLI
jgi:hypothetical protein